VRFALKVAIVFVGWQILCIVLIVAFFSLIGLVFKAS
jgi:hypothetical protein